MILKNIKIKKTPDLTRLVGAADEFFSTTGPNAGLTSGPLIFLVVAACRPNKWPSSPFRENARANKHTGILDLLVWLVPKTGRHCQP